MLDFWQEFWWAACVAARALLVFAMSWAGVALRAATFVFKGNSEAVLLLFTARESCRIDGYHFLVVSTFVFE